MPWFSATKFYPKISPSLFQVMDKPSSNWQEQEALVYENSDKKILQDEGQTSVDSLLPEDSYYSFIPFRTSSDASSRAPLAGVAHSAEVFIS